MIDNTLYRMRIGRFNCMKCCVKGNDGIKMDGKEYGWNVIWMEWDMDGRGYGWKGIWMERER